MEHHKNFLLNKIITYDKENGLKSLGQLPAKCVNDVSEVIKEFAELTAIEVIEHLNKGEAVEINGTVFCMKKIKGKK